MEKKKEDGKKESKASIELVLPDIDITEKNQPRFKLRDKPFNKNKIVSPTKFKEIFKLGDDRKPLKYISNQYKDNGDGTISDFATGLIWQKDGSPLLAYSRLAEYAKKINQSRIGGLNKWRLPVIDELISLLEPEKQGNGLYIKDIFFE